MRVRAIHRSRSYAGAKMLPQVDEQSQRAPLIASKASTSTLRHSTTTACANSTAGTPEHTRRNHTYAPRANHPQTQKSSTCLYCAPNSLFFGSTCLSLEHLMQYALLPFYVPTISDPSCRTASFFWPKERKRKYLQFCSTPRSAQLTTGPRTALILARAKSHETR